MVACHRLSVWCVVVEFLLSILVKQHFIEVVLGRFLCAFLAVVAGCIIILYDRTMGLLFLPGFGCTIGWLFVLTIATLESRDRLGHATSCLDETWLAWWLARNQSWVQPVSCARHNTGRSASNLIVQSLNDDFLLLFLFFGGWFFVLLLSNELRSNPELILKSYERINQLVLFGFEELIDPINLIYESMDPLNSQLFWQLEWFVHVVWLHCVQILDCNLFRQQLLQLSHP